MHLEIKRLRGSPSETAKKNAFENSAHANYLNLNNGAHRHDHS
jgi:hypothetical protein